jgi:acyl-CoA thioester hydrolase
LSTIKGLFFHSICVPDSSIDQNGHANNLEYLRWMQEAATAHSDAQGWTLARYLESRTSWVIRSQAIEYLRPAFAGEALTVLTWIGGFGETESPRHYLFWRERDRKILAKACTKWVFIDAKTGRPQPIPLDFRSVFDLVAKEQDVLRILREPGFVPPRS